MQLYQILNIPNLNEADHAPVPVPDHTHIPIRPADAAVADMDDHPIVIIAARLATATAVGITDDPTAVAATNPTDPTNLTIPTTVDALNPHIADVPNHHTIDQDPNHDTVDQNHDMADHLHDPAHSRDHLTNMTKPNAIPAITETNDTVQQL